MLIWCLVHTRVVKLYIKQVHVYDGLSDGFSVMYIDTAFRDSSALAVPSWHEYAVCDYLM